MQDLLSQLLQNHPALILLCYHGDLLQMTGLPPWIDRGKAFKWLEKQGFVEPASTKEHLHERPYKDTSIGRWAIRELTRQKISDFIERCPKSDQETFSKAFQELLKSEEYFANEYPNRLEFSRFPKIRYWKDYGNAEVRVLECKCLGNDQYELPIEIKCKRCGFITPHIHRVDLKNKSEFWLGRERCPCCKCMQHFEFPYYLGGRWRIIR